MQIFNLKRVIYTALLVIFVRCHRQTTKRFQVEFDHDVGTMNSMYTVKYLGRVETFKKLVIGQAFMCPISVSIHLQCSQWLQNDLADSRTLTQVYNFSSRIPTQVHESRNLGWVSSMSSLPLQIFIDQRSAGSLVKQRDLKCTFYRCSVWCLWWC